jgi:hypothetical protein
VAVSSISVFWFHFNTISQDSGNNFYNFTFNITGARGSIVVKALCYKPEGREFYTPCGECISSIYLILPDALGPGVYSASNRNEYQKQKNNVSGE